MNRRILHDSAHGTALKLLEIVKPCLREQEWRDAYAEFYAVVREGLMAYEKQVQRTASRLQPPLLSNPLEGDPIENEAEQTCD